MESLEGFGELDTARHSAEIESSPADYRSWIHDDMLVETIYLCLVCDQWKKKNSMVSTFV